jgi:hypothetical protein
MLQNRRSVRAGTCTPNRPRSRSRNACTKSSRQSRLSSSERARKDRGDPPRHHSRRRWASVNSSSPKPPIGTKATRPARDSETPRTRSGEALPSSRNRAGRGCRSASTRSRGKRPGWSWASSITIGPRSGPRAVAGWLRRLWSPGASRSKYSARRRAAKVLASVVLPHWRGPRRSTTGLARSRPSTRARRPLRSTVFIKCAF